MSVLRMIMKHNDLNWIWFDNFAGEDKGMYAWIATNYALGTLGGEPDATVGIVELGGASLKVLFNH